MSMAVKSINYYISRCLVLFKDESISVIDSLEALLASHMVYELENELEIEYEYKLFGDLFLSDYDNVDVIGDKLAYRVCAIQEVLESDGRSAYQAISKRLTTLSNIGNGYDEFLTLVDHLRLYDIDLDSGLTVNKLCIQSLLGLIIKASTNQRIGLVSNFVCEIAACLFEECNVKEVYDPFSGTGKLAIESVKGNATVCNSRVVLNDITQNCAFLSLARLLGSNVQHFQVNHFDSLRQLSSSRHQATILFPPIKAKVEGYQDLYGHLPYFIKNDGLPLFIESAIESTKELSLIVVPDSFLFEGNKVADYRKSLIERGLVRAVVSLPPKSVSGTSINVSLLVLDKTRTNGIVFLIDGSNTSKRRGLFGYEEQLAMKAQDVAQLISRNHPKNEFGEAVFDISNQRLLKDSAVLRYDYYLNNLLLSDLNDFMSGFASKNVSQLRLDRLCLVKVGKAVSKEIVSEERKSGSAPYIRVADLKGKNQILPKRWIDSSNYSKAPEREEKEAIAFSIQGVVGKVGQIPREEDYYPGIGIAVLSIKDDSVLPEYLLHYLSSDFAKLWYEAFTGSSTIKRINKRYLGSLPVIVPPLDWQRMICKERQKSDADVFRLLSSLDKDHTNTELTIPLNRLLKLIGKFCTEVTKVSTVPPYVDLFSAMLKVLSGIDTEKLDEMSGRDARVFGSIDWLKRSFSIVTNLAIVPESEHDRVLALAKRRLEDATLDLEDGYYIDSLLQSIVDQSMDLVDLLIEETQWEYSITAEPDYSEGSVDGSLALNITNRFRFPLVNLTINSEQINDQKSIQYIGGGDTKKISVLLKEHVRALKLQWNAFDLDNSPRTGEIECNNIAVKEAEALQEWKASPYITGDPVKPNQSMSLYGRANILTSISRYISESGNVVLLEGNRRVGKSSILYHLQGSELIPGWLCVYMSLQECEGCEQSGIPAWSIWQVMTSQIIIALIKAGITVHLPDGSSVSSEGNRFYQRKVKGAVKNFISQNNPFYDFEAYLEEILSIVKEHNLGIVIMIDEFDKLQEGIDNGVTTPQVPENIRSIIHKYDNLSAILTGSRRLQRLRQEYWSALFGLGTRIPVSELDEKDARKLVIEPSKGQLQFSEEAVELIVQQTGRYPFLIQCLCNRIFDIAASKNIRQIDTAFVKQAIKEFLKDNEHFMYFWDLASVSPGNSRCQLMLFMFAKAELSGSHLTSGELLEELLEYGIDPSEKMYEQLLNYLQELEMIKKSGSMGEQRYSLTTPLLAEWLVDSMDYQRVLASAQQEFEKD